MTLRAIVFDFDGVIADSEPLHFASFRDVLAEEDIGLTEREYYARYLGYDDVGAFRTIGIDRGQPWAEHEIAALVVRKAARMETRDRALLFPGAADAVRRAAAVAPIAVASGALRREIVRVLEHEGLARLFTAIVAAEDTPAGKPAPDPYVRAVALLASAIGAPLGATECVAIEDSHWGLESAQAAGLRTVLVSQTERPGDLPKADLVIRTLADLDVAALRAIFEG